MENGASRFGQRLAHTEKKYRDQALKKLSAYLSKRAQWNELEWDKLWKALFYCMWMSDKRPVQDELSTNLAALVHKIPAVDDAMGFVHSFFRTMHREWHGIDGLRLDKFYSLIRKFVHQTLLLLQNHEWDRALVERFVSILSSEVMSQLPNGLRLHTTDLFLTELHGAGGETVDTETFLLLLEPFFTLLSSEYDKTVFKRVRELVFLPMLSEYKFGPQPPKQEKKKSENDETDGEEDEEEPPKVFEQVELPFVQHRIFAIASADDTAERNRSVLYDLYSHFFKVTKIDSLKANQDANNKPKKATKKRKEPEPEAEAEPAAESDEPKKKKKNKRRKKNKQSEGEEDADMDEKDTEVKEEEEAPVVEAVTPEKKKKKGKKEADEAKTPVNTPVKAAEETPTKKQKKAKAADDVVMEAAKALEVATPESAKKSKKAKKTEAEVETAPEESTTSKKQKKDKKKVEEEVAAALEEVAHSKPVKADEEETPSKKSKKKNSEVETTPSKKEKQIKTEETTPIKKEPKVSEKSTPTKEKKVKVEDETPIKKEKKTKESDSNVVVRSGMKFRRCGGCGGIGKGLVPVGKDFCRHCERTGQAKKKTAKAAEEVTSKESTPSKKEKKVKKEVESAETTPSKKDKKDKKDADASVVVRSGMKFRRCGGCGGIGKGLVPVGKDCCRHCERTGQQKKKEQAADKKKRKAEVLAAAAAEDEAAAPSKKVTFGKNRALPHELSVKRLKASKAVVKELTSDIKGVLKAGSSPAATPSKSKTKSSGGRMKAADFF